MMKPTKTPHRVWVPPRVIQARGEFKIDMPPGVDFFDYRWEAESRGIHLHAHGKYYRIKEYCNGYVVYSREMV
jgi:hypothetical protein